MVSGLCLSFNIRKEIKRGQSWFNWCV